MPDQPFPKARHELMMPHVTVWVSALILAGWSVHTFAEDMRGVVDRPGFFTMKVIDPKKKGFGDFALHWRTDKELVVEAAAFSDWRAEGPGDQHIFSWDVDKDEITELPYVGRVVCVAPHRIVLQRAVRDPSNSSKVRSALWTAVIGEPAQLIESGYNEYNCEPLTQRLPGNAGNRTVPLNPGHGNVRKDLRPGNENVWFLPDQGGEIHVGSGKAASFGEEIANPGDMT